jgi:hypothetical protein
MNQIKYIFLITLSLSVFSTIFSEAVFSTQKSKLQIRSVFRTDQDSPQFQIIYKNETDRVLDLTDLITQSAIILDGKRWPNRILKFGGNPELAPGETWNVAIDIGAYVEGAERVCFSNELKRWRWNVPLSSGTHSVIVEFGG